MTLLPLLAARPLPRPIWLWSGASTAMLALVAAVVDGLQPTYSTWQPQRLDINFVDDHISRKAFWTIDTPAPLPGSLRAIANFSAKPDLSVPVSLQPSYSAPAGALRFDLPTADVVSVQQGGGRTLALAVRGAQGSNQIVVLVPKEMGLVRVSIDGKPFEPSPDSLNPRGTIIACVTNDCRNKSMRLTFATRRPLDLLIAEQHYGLPPDGARLAGARPGTAIASQSGDTTIVFGNLHIP
jgi:hypothetical protein